MGLQAFWDDNGTCCIIRHLRLESQFRRFEAVYLEFDHFLAEGLVARQVALGMHP
jgi:hypothetical protein